MKLLTLATAAALLVAGPAIAHEGALHEGCPAGQAFTAGDLTITDAFTRATLPNARAAGGFMQITNAGAADDRLLGATTAVAERTEVHEMKMVGEVMQMQALPDGLAIPAGATATLAPGGFHVMMMGLLQPLRHKECVEMVLHFEAAGDVPVQLSIGDTAARSAPHGHDGHGGEHGEGAPPAQ